MAKRLRPWIAGLLAATASLSAAAQTVACRYSYGGETRVLHARPVESPYGVPDVKVGSYFRFRVVFQAKPADLASIKVYTYADRDEGPAPLHQATYPYPPGAGKAASPYGFTGLNFVYEPVRDGELQYWCELETEGGKNP